MKKRAIILILVSAIIMFLSLFLTVNYVGGNDGLGAILLLFFMIYPAFSAVLGLLCGKQFKKLFFVPILNGIFFLTSAWIFLEAFEPAFLIGAVVYSAIGLAVSGVVALFKNKKTKIDS